MIDRESGIGFFNIKRLLDCGVFHLFLARHKGFSEGPYSSLNLGLKTKDDPEAVRKNEAAVRNAFGIRSIVRARQVHGSDVIEIDGPLENERGFIAGEADALVTNLPGVALAVLTADCFPVILASQINPEVAIIHVGRRGICMGVIERTIEKMGEGFGTPTEEMIAGIGPGIGPCCYRVDENIAGDFRSSFPDDVNRILKPAGEGLFSLDLYRGIEVSLRRSGVTEIERVNLCTSCNEDMFFSHRRDKGVTGRQMNLVMIPESGYPDNRSNG